MKSRLNIPLRIIIISFIFIGACFTANAFTINLCFKVDNGTIDNLAPYEDNWKLWIPNAGNISDNFRFPHMENDNEDYCIAPVIVNDSNKNILLTNPVSMVEQIDAVDPIPVPSFPAVIMKYCKLEFYGKAKSWHMGSDQYDFSTVTPISCQFPDFAVPNQI